MSSFLANSNVVRVSQGMMGIINTLDNYTKSEKHAIIAGVFNCLYNHKLAPERSVSDVMLAVDSMRHDCKLKHLPEFGAAENYIKGEL